MRIVGCDLHGRQQTLAMLETTTGEGVKMTLKHEDTRGKHANQKRLRLVPAVRFGRLRR
jgi:hypothetical protein